MTNSLIRSVWAVTLVALPCLVPSVASGEDSRWTGRCQKVIDGDTIQVKRDRSVVQVELAGIDCPELGQDFGRESKDFSIQLLEGKIVTVIVESELRQVTIGKVEIYGKDASLMIVREGFGWVYPRVPTSRTLMTAETDARTENLGLWQDESPVPPWVWRTGHRNGLIPF